MKDFWAKFLSTVIHPLLTPTYSVLTIWYWPFLKLKGLLGTENLQGVLVWMIVFSTLLPVAFLLILRKTGVISSVTLNDRRDRKYPLPGAMVSNIGLAIVFQSLEMGNLLKMMALASATLILLCWIITFWWKISIHMASLGGYLAILLWGFHADGRPMLLPFALATLLAALLGWARVERKAHSPTQVMAGLFLGMLILSLFLAPVVL
jgi:hypothetical protein